MRAGKLRTRVKLQAATVTASTAFNEPVSTWSTFATVWAGRRDMGGREFLTGEQPRADVRAIWDIRHRSDVTNATRLVESASTGNVWDISSAVDPDGRRRMLELRAVMRVD